MNRVLFIRNLNDAKAELKKLNVSSQGVEVMATKAIGAMIKLTDVKVGAANILKQEMLSIGGDAAVARGVVNGTLPLSDVILLGNSSKIKKLIKKLNYQTIFGLPAIKEDLKKLLKQLYHIEIKEINANRKLIKFDFLKVMGILNVTPDSFSDGNKYYDVEKAVLHAKEMIKDGVDIIDIGGESTRPGAEKISYDEEYKRVIPVIKEIRKFSDVIISIDTSKAKIAEDAINAGADIVNDISALSFDTDMIKVLGKYPNIPIILMHMQGTPKDMQTSPHYNDVIEEILSFFGEKINYCVENGIDRNRIIIDPGIGFGKRQQDNLSILKRLGEFRAFDLPTLLGTSRKSFINKIYTSQPIERLEGTLATTAKAFYAGISIVRVHDVKENVNLIKTLKAVEESE